MKTPEDEAWEEMERKQGGGGFPAKRRMAADKLGWPPSSVITPEYLAEQENKNKKMRALLDDDDDTQDYKRPWVGLTDEQRLMALKFIDPQTARLPPGFKQFAESIEKLLKDQNV